eukprot:3015075-Lingulodinium_polyedra.AAC.1
MAKIHHQRRDFDQQRLRRKLQRRHSLIHQRSSTPTSTSGRIAKKTKSYVPLVDRDIYHAMIWVEERQTPITPQQVEIQCDDTSSGEMQAISL